MRSHARPLLASSAARGSVFPSDGLSEKYRDCQKTTTRMTRDFWCCESKRRWCSGGVALLSQNDCTFTNSLMAVHCKQSICLQTRCATNTVYTGGNDECRRLCWPRTVRNLLVSTQYQNRGKRLDCQCVS